MENSVLKPRVAISAPMASRTRSAVPTGTAGPGAIGAMSTANLIRRAREDDQIKAVVLRVDSPGGSAYGSELIRRELELTRAAGKPVVVSMGGVAASGGYWISMASDEVIADPSTVTGSIGGLSTSKLIRAAREDKNIKAVVLRVDSPGGSAFASELILRELELTRPPTPVVPFSIVL